MAESQKKSKGNITPLGVAERRASWIAAVMGEARADRGGYKIVSVPPMPFLSYPFSPQMGYFAGFSPPASRNFASQSSEEERSRGTTTDVGRTDS